MHDATTHNPAVGAVININGNTVTTDSQGVAIAETTQDVNTVITIEYDYYLPFVYTKRTFSPTLLTPSGRFLTYMYTDRPSYRPTDTVDIFGVVIPRAGQNFLPDDIFTLHIGDMMEFQITFDALGAFNKRVPVEGMFGNMEIRVNINGERLMSTWINFLDYANISFVLGGELNKNAFFFREETEAEIFVTNFAGLPIEGISLADGNRRTIVTNESGIAAGNFPAGWAQLTEFTGWGLFRSSHWLNVISGAQQSQSIQLPYILAPRDIMLEVEQEGSTAFLTSSKITLDNFNADSSLDINDADNFRGELVDIDFTVRITRHVTTRTLRRQDYDHINRRTVNVYDFNTTASIYRNTEERTQNGRAIVTDLPHSNDPLISYSIEFRYVDSRGLLSVVNLPWQGFLQREESAFRHFGFVLENRETDTALFDWGQQFSFRDLRIGETTNVILKEDTNAQHMWWGDFSQASTPSTGRLLAVLVRDGILSATVGSPQGTPITFTEEAISNGILFGAYFDMGYVFAINNPISVHYDFTERELQIDIEFDAEKYAPGGEVTVTIKTADENGQAIPARVILSVVDESGIVGWGEHRANFLSRLYTSSPMFLWGWGFQFEQFVSFTQRNFGGGGGGAEGGGGDNGGTDPVFREDFTDNPIFEVIQTDENGTASFTFTLPHQVTSWRVTAIGLTEDGFAGDTRPNIISTLPFFVDLILTNEYIVGDDIAAVARIFTDGTMNRVPVEFLFEILQNDEIIFTDAQTIANRAGRAVVNAGKLDAGYYTMRVTATMGEYQDAIALPFTVAETGMILPVNVHRQISTGTQQELYFEMRNLPVRINMSNANIGPLMGILHGALDWSSIRTDHTAARAFANNFHGWQDEDVRGQIHDASGGIPELPHENATLFYTARFAASFPEFVNRENIIRFTADITDTASNTVRAARLLALAAVGEPVLLEINEEIFRTLNNENDLINTSYNTRISVLYLASALITAGDHIGAQNLIQQLNEFDGTLTDTQRESIQTAMLFINSAINPQAAWEYLRPARRNQFVSDVPERINFVRRAIVLGENISEVKYYLNGQTHTALLEDFTAHSLHITPEQFANLNLTAISGATDLHIQFYGYDTRNWDESRNRLGITKNIVSVGELYRVDLTVTFPPGLTGTFTIYDRLPSNMRFVPAQRAWGRDWIWVSNPQRQLVEISFGRTHLCVGPRTVSYFAMKLFDADMCMGTTYVSNNSFVSHVWGTTR